MSATMTDLTRADEKAISRLAKDLKAQANRARLAGLDERAETLEEEAATATERLREARQHRKARDRERERMRDQAQERHDAAMAEREQEAKRREEARAWLESAIAHRGGNPVPAGATLQMAEAAGHRPDDVLAVAVKLRRRGRNADDTEYLGRRGRYLRRDWLEV